MMAKIASRLAPLQDWLLVSLLGLPLLTPFFRTMASACTHDGHLHYHRIAAIKYAWQNGLYFTRWLPDLAFGYGYPFFNYREPAPLYLTLIPHTLGLPLPAAVNLFYMLCILAAGWFMYLWVRDIFGRTPAIISAVAYMAAPYVLIDAIIRGNQPESLALPLFPLLLWGGRRFVLQGTAVPFLISVFGLLFLALSHNISLLLFTPILFIYLALITWLNRINLKKAAVRVALIFALGLGLTAFYVGPALLELDQITISQSVTTRNNDFRFNFATLDEIFAPVHTADPSLLNRPLLIRLGWAPTLLAVAGVGRFLLTQRRKGSAGILPARREKQGHILMMAFAAIALLLMSLSISRPLWENVPLIEFVQFPWRFIGRAALPMAFLSGTAFAGINTKSLQLPISSSVLSRQLPNHLLIAATIFLLLLEAIPYLYPHYCLDQPYPTINTVHAYEHNTGLVGVDPEGSYFPITVQQHPQGSPLEADYQAGQIPQRFDPTQLPEGASIQSVNYGTNSAEITLTTPDPFQAAYQTFFFPGWTALIDGRQVDITPSNPEGLITFPIPPGQHTIQIRWQSTFLRQLMTLITFLCAVGVLITTIRLPVARFGKSLPSQQETDTNLPYRFLLLTAVLILLLKLLIIDNIPTPLRQETGPTVENPTHLRANELVFAGYTLDQQTIPSGSTFDINLAWQVLAQPDINYQSNIWLVSSDGTVWSDKDTQRPRIYESTAPTSLWVANQWAWDSREVQILPGTPPGQYDIVLTLFNLANLEPITLLNEDGSVRGPTAVIGTITITTPNTPPDFQPQFPLQTQIGGLDLLGYSQDRTEAIPGEQFLLTLYWENGSEPSPPIRQELLALNLLDNNNNIVNTWAVPFVRRDYPPAIWKSGEKLRGQHLIPLPGSLESGRYQFRLEDANLEEVKLGIITINAPNRLFSPPDFETAVNATFNNQIDLIGYTTETDASSNNLNVTLIWQAQTELPTSYRVFVHLVDESGLIITQSDGEPANWTRPTTGWAPGEYIIDPHQLTLPNGTIPPNSTLRIGLYDPTTNIRLQTNSNDFIPLSPQ